MSSLSDCTILITSFLRPGYLRECLDIASMNRRAFLSTMFEIIFPIVVLALVVFAIRMSYEKFCIRMQRPFKSWLKDGAGQ